MKYQARGHISVGRPKRSWFPEQTVLANPWNEEEDDDGDDDYDYDISNNIKRNRFKEWGEERERVL